MGIVILVPGQGNQHAAMFDRLVDNVHARDVLQEVAEVLGIDLPQALAQRHGSEIYENRFAQPLMCGANLASWHAIRAQVPRPALMIGYSVGELAAYGCAGALSTRETMRLAVRRAALMDAAGEQNFGRHSGLLALRGLDAADIQTLCATHRLEVAAINGFRHFVLGGLEDDLTAAADAAGARGATTVRRLHVAVASHTSLLYEAGKAFEGELRVAEFSDPKTPLLGGYNAAVVRDWPHAAKVLARQLYRPLVWQACLDAAVSMGHRVFIQIGPGAALVRMLREAHPHVQAFAIEEFASLNQLIDRVGASVETNDAALTVPAIPLNV